MARGYSVGGVFGFKEGPCYHGASTSTNWVCLGLFLLAEQRLKCVYVIDGKHITANGKLALFRKNGLCDGPPRCRNSEVGPEKTWSVEPAKQTAGKRGARRPEPSDAGIPM